MNDTKEMLFCNFCGKKQNQVKKLIAGPDVYICNECIELCYDIIKDDNKNNISLNNELPTPRQIHNFLDEYIIGQDYAKEVLSVSIYNHYIRLQNPIVDDVELDKSNVLLAGSTGSGKTHIAKTIARILDVPFTIADATTFTANGYVGSDVENMIARLLENANQDVQKAEKGIVYIDEIDKKASRAENTSITRDVSGEDVQQALLKIIEGTKCNVQPQGKRKNPQSETVEVDTTNILFIVGGAFVGLEDLIESENTKEKSIGFNANVDVSENEKETGKHLLDLEPHHLVKYGLVPELVGRLSIFVNLHELNENELIQVLCKPKNSIVKQFKKMFEIQNIKLEFDENSLKEIANNAFKRKTGARGLRSVLEKCIIPIQYELPELKEKGINKVIINENVIKKNEKPLYEYENNAESN